MVLYIRENESEQSRCLDRVSYDGVAHLGGFREFLEGCKEKPIVPWPFDFWDLQLSARIATELEQRNTLEMHDHFVTVIKSHGGQSVGITKPTIISKSFDAGSSSSTGDQNLSYPTWLIGMFFH